MNGVTLNHCDSEDYPTGGKLSCAKGIGVSALNCISKPKSSIVRACLRVNPLDMPRTSGSYPPCPITPPSRHRLYICHQWTSMDYDVTDMKRLSSLPHWPNMQIGTLINTPIYPAVLEVSCAFYMSYK